MLRLTAFLGGGIESVATSTERSAFFFRREVVSRGRHLRRLAHFKGLRHMTGMYDADIVLQKAACRLLAPA